jgi:hypothetical protein
MFLTSHVYPSARAAGFGTEPRGGRRSRHQSPGPGEYDAMASVGAQALSTRVNMPTVSRLAPMARRARGAGTHAAAAAAAARYYCAAQPRRPRARRSTRRGQEPGAHSRARGALLTRAPYPFPPSRQAGFGALTAKRDRRPQQASDLGPAAYTLPPWVGGRAIKLSTVHSSPAFSLKDRLPSPESRFANRDVPGPGAYAQTQILGHSALSNVVSPPAWGMHLPRPHSSPTGAEGSLDSLASSGDPAEAARLRRAANSPGPGEYSPNSSFVEPAPPRYSLGRRSTSPGPRAGSGNLGPGSYDIASVYGLGDRRTIGTAALSPSFSLRPRTTDNTASRNRRYPSPAPNEYTMPPALGPSPVYASAGEFSMRPRLERGGGANASPGPGPGEYRVPSTVGGVKVQSTVATAPFWGFGIGDRPGPRAPATPGPGAYRVPASFRPLSPDSVSGITLRGRLAQGTPEAAALKNDSPGPAAFGQLDVTALGTHPKVRTPGLSHGPRMEMTRAQREQAEGPKTVLAAIDYNKVKAAAPSFSLRGRSQPGRRNATEIGPAAYNLQGSGLKSVQRRNTPSWTLKARWHVDERGNGVPGPGAYGELVMPFLDMKLGKSARGGSPGARSRASSPSGSPGISPQTSLYDLGGDASPAGPSRARSPAQNAFGRMSMGPGLAAMLNG